jgi:hypothetical protein
MHRIISGMRNIKVDNLAFNHRREFPDATDAEVTRHLMQVSVPPSVLHSPKWWRTELADLKAVVEKLGLPSLFLTLTADEFSPTRFSEMDALQAFLDAHFRNPSVRPFSSIPSPLSRSLQHCSSLTPFHNVQVSWQDCPVECAHLFHTRLQAFFKKYVLGGHAIYGKVLEHVVRYEVQARGSLHAHILLWIDDADLAALRPQIVATCPHDIGPDGELLPPADPLVGHTLPSIYVHIQHQLPLTASSCCPTPCSP